jgi:hypothetical protein
MTVVCASSGQAGDNHDDGRAGYSAPSPPTHPLCAATRVVALRGCLSSGADIVQIILAGGEVEPPAGRSTGELLGQLEGFSLIGGDRQLAAFPDIPLIDRIQGREHGEVAVLTAPPALGDRDWPAMSAFHGGPGDRTAAVRASAVRL